MLKIEVIYIAADQQVFQHFCELPVGSTVNDALKEADVYTQFPEVVELPVGIFAKKVAKDTPLRDGDRVEIYRALTNDPKEKRRIRAKNQ